jgi:hypothetical protein
MLSVAPSRAGPPNNDVSDSLGNTAGGTGALQSNTTGYQNTAWGYFALRQNTTGYLNSGFGFQALAANTTGYWNTAFGNFALSQNPSGVGNTAFGDKALAFNTIGNDNIAMGEGALGYTSSGSNNIAIGTHALFLDRTANYNIAIGNFSGGSLTNGSENIYLGNHISGGSATESNTMRLGDAQSRTFIAGIRGVQTGLGNAVTVFIDGNGQLGTLNSSARFKDDIRDMADYSRAIFDLRPVTYHYKEPATGGSKPLEAGLIAEEVAKVYPDLVVYGSDGQLETVQYHKLTPMLLNELQRQQRTLNMQAEQLNAQARQIAEVDAQNQALRNALEELKAEVQATMAVRTAAAENGSKTRPSR